jgi:hypothetical protein
VMRVMRNYSAHCFAAAAQLAPPRCHCACADPCPSWGSVRPPHPPTRTAAAWTQLPHSI